jgi:hypothetical protein
LWLSSSASLGYVDTISTLSCFVKPGLDHRFGHWDGSKG